MLLYSFDNRWGLIYFCVHLRNQVGLKVNGHFEWLSGFKYEDIESETVKDSFTSTLLLKIQDLSLNYRKAQPRL